jgi:hypothetical protein
MIEVAGSGHSLVITQPLHMKSVPLSKKLSDSIQVQASELIGRNPAVPTQPTYDQSKNTKATPGN